MKDAAALVFEGVSRTFASGETVVSALQSVDLGVQAGKVTGLIGPDGAGKTTLMRLAAGLLRPDAGQIHVLGINVRRTAARGSVSDRLHAAALRSV